VFPYCFPTKPLNAQLRGVMWSRAPRCQGWAVVSLCPLQGIPIDASPAPRPILRPQIPICLHTHVLPWDVILTLIVFLSLKASPCVVYPPVVSSSLPASSSLSGMGPIGPGPFFVVDLFEQLRPWLIRVHSLNARRSGQAQGYNSGAQLCHYQPPSYPGLTWNVQSLIQPVTGHS
jgi:hypothetical protein